MRLVKGDQPLVVAAALADPGFDVLDGGSAHLVTLSSQLP